MRPSSSLLFTSVAALLGAAACNLVTGADDLKVYDTAPKKSSGGDGRDDDGDGGNDGQGGAAATQGPGAGAGTTGTDTTTSGTPGEELVDVAGVSIVDVSFYQGVKARLVANGAPSNPVVGVVANRDAFVRVFTDVSGYDGLPVVVRLLIQGQAPLEIDSTLSAGSESSKSSTVNFDLPAAMLTPGAAFRVEVKRRQVGQGPVSPQASYPSDGSYAATGATTTGPLRITLVPISYGADGSNRLPDTSAGMVSDYQAYFNAIYPTSQLVLTVNGAVGWDGDVDADGTGWDDLLNAIANFRSDQGAGFDEYYYGIFNPSGSTDSFCGGGCVAGLGFVPGLGDDYLRAAIGLGYGGSLSTETAAHEVGHNHGRDHAPCGTSGDPNYPHSGAKTGEWGFDLSTHSLKNPSTHVDLMSYCSPTWVSDYNYNAFFDRIRSINGSDFFVPEEARMLEYERVAVRDDVVTWLEPATIERPPQGQRRRLTVEDEAGALHDVDAGFFRYDHLDGGLYVFPRGDGWHAKRVTLASAYGDLEVAR